MIRTRTHWAGPGGGEPLRRLVRLTNHAGTRGHLMRLVREHGPDARTNLLVTDDYPTFLVGTDLERVRCVEARRAAA